MAEDAAFWADVAKTMGDGGSLASSRDANQFDRSLSDGLDPEESSRRRQLCSVN